MPAEAEVLANTRFSASSNESRLLPDRQAPGTWASVRPCSCACWAWRALSALDGRGRPVCLPTAILASGSGL